VLPVVRIFKAVSKNTLSALAVPLDSLFITEGGAGLFGLLSPRDVCLTNFQMILFMPTVMPPEYRNQKEGSLCDEIVENYFFTNFNKVCPATSAT
jgi:hypothetical protein